MSKDLSRTTRGKNSTKPARNPRQENNEVLLAIIGFIILMCILSYTL
jgi:hypothetical protein